MKACMSLNELVSKSPIKHYIHRMSYAGIVQQIVTGHMLGLLQDISALFQ